MPVPRKPSCSWEIDILGSEAPVPVSASIVGWRPMFLAAARNCQTPPPLAPAAYGLFLPRKKKRGKDSRWAGEAWDRRLRLSQAAVAACFVDHPRVVVPPLMTAMHTCAMPSARRCTPAYVCLLSEGMWGRGGTLTDCQVRLYAQRPATLSCPCTTPGRGDAESRALDPPSRARLWDTFRCAGPGWGR